MAGHTVLVDAQFGVTRILRPFAGFEASYQGKAVTTNPIAFTEGGRALDALAGTPGYAPNLLRGLPVPMGAKVILWIPTILGGDANGNFIYKYAVSWRLRSTFDYRQTRGPYHYPKQGKGVDDTTAPPGKRTRVVKPAAWQPVQYIQPEPAPTLFGLQTDRAASNLHSLDLAIRGGLLQQPCVPGGAPNSGAVQQGLYDPAVSSTATIPIFVGYELPVVQGDELMILGYRSTLNSQGGAVNNWDFAAGHTDSFFAQFYGNAAGVGTPFPDIGIYVMVGTHT